MPEFTEVYLTKEEADEAVKKIEAFGGKATDPIEGANGWSVDFKTPDPAPEVTDAGTDAS